MKRNHRIALITSVCLGLALALTACGKKERASAGGDYAPAFTLQASDGTTVKLSDYAGKVVLLDFWASWCPPCRAAIPHIVELQTALGAQGFQAVGLNLDENPDDLTAFLQENPVNYPMAKADDKVRTDFGGVSAIPLVLLIDRQGRIRERFQGYTPEIAESMRKTAEALLKEGG